jgi:lipopolysaccharide/colanic/teichoic acid biosynthesis glycosyltransferase
VIQGPVIFEAGAGMSLESNKSVARVAQTTIEEVVAVIGLDGWTKRILDIILATTGLILFAPILLLMFLGLCPNLRFYHLYPIDWLTRASP